MVRASQAPRQSQAERISQAANGCNAGETKRTSQMAYSADADQIIHRPSLDGGFMEVVEEEERLSSILSSLSGREGSVDWNAADDNLNRDGYGEPGPESQVDASRPSRRLSIRDKVALREQARESRRQSLNQIQLQAPSRDDVSEGSGSIIDEEVEEEEAEDEAPNSPLEKTVVAEADDLLGKQSVLQEGWAPRMTKLTTLQIILSRADKFWEERAKPGGWDRSTRSDTGSGTHVKAGIGEPRAPYGGKWQVLSKRQFHKKSTPNPKNSVHNVTDTTPKITGDQNKNPRPPRPLSSEGFRMKVQFPPRSSAPIMRPGNKVDYGLRRSYVSPKITECTYTHGGRFNSRST
eukprot:gnl/MRDRNA2_/MRDRNA2_112532_c0_seq1.p1 gnl/MRDRNA2_/MRDRNA2_112532_c0~~gnl/MRDRNA2_/MRDRNA2_112532_c0_seq1.p1  ORF type:complete len:349 (+),score=65.93 gnl/MRDRNA2_/MRDRNA2_112532_c0_seq1:119-1165(+)